MKKNFFYIIFLISTLFILKLLIGCSDTVSTSSNLIFPDSSVSYISNVEPFMRVKCAYSGCHSDPPYNEGTTMTTYFSLFSTDNLGLVIPENPNGSKLIQILEGRLPHNYYIFPKGYFTENQIKGMRKWIEEGAKNN